MKKIYTIGRDEGCDIVIQDSTDVISRLHATIRVEPNDKIFLIDQSRNGTYINGMKMSSNVEIPVSRKDVISFAHIYNLDWSTVPKHKGGILKTILITLICLIIITGGTLAALKFLNNSDKDSGITNTTESLGITSGSDAPAPPEPIAAPDTTSVPVVKEKPKPIKEEKDTIKVEEPQEEVYNPIY